MLLSALDGVSQKRCSICINLRSGSYDGFAMELPQSLEPAEAESAVVLPYR